MKIDYDGGSFTAEEVIKFLQFAGKAKEVFADVIKQREVARKAAAEGLVVSDEALQQYADSFRRREGLITRESTLAFLRANALTEDDFENYCEVSLLIPAVRDQVANPDQVERFFFDNRSSFDRARVSVIRVREQNLAGEVFMQVTEDEEDFHLLARKYSIDESTRYAGGHLGLVGRDYFSAEVSAKIFNAVAGELIGPFKFDNTYVLILVEEIIKTDLTPEVTEMIKDQLFDEWLAQARGGALTISF